MFKKILMMMPLLAAVLVLKSAGPALAGHDQVPGHEGDRGTLRKPDEVAVPHPNAEKTAQDNALLNVPNRSLADDANHDGVLSRQEWKGSQEDFNRLDLNRDNVLSQRELDSYVQMGIDRFADMDRNRDGFISHGEWVGDSHLFHQLDHNNDGMLTRSEFYQGKDATAKGEE